MAQCLKLLSILVFFCVGASALRTRVNTAGSQESVKSLTNKTSDERAKAEGAPPLKLFGSSWNAYNRIWKRASDADDMIRTIIDGHDAADLVMIGFQEYLDDAQDGTSVAERLRSNLWEGEFAENARELHEMHQQDVPEDVLHAKANILKKFQAFHSEVDQALRDIRHTFGNASPSSAHFIPTLKTSLQGVDSILQKHNQEDYDAHFSKINSWSETMDAEHERLLQKIPNFQLDADGAHQHEEFKNTFKKVPVDAYRALDNRYESAKQKINSMLQDVEIAAAKVVAEKIAEIQGHMDLWLGDVNNYVGRIGSKSHLELGHGNVVVKSISEIFDSDSILQERKSKCHGWPAHHYNTDIRVFVNPWSAWKLVSSSVEKYSIDQNGEAKGFLGQNGQCGKGVNVVKARLEANTGHKLNVCMINGHLSFKYPFLHRLYNLKDALSSLSGGHGFNPNDLQCDIVAMTADFNSRLTCKPVAANHTMQRALCDTPESPNEDALGNSFHTIMSTFCDSNGKCSLSANEGNAQADELTQFMKNPKLNCFEYDKKSKDWYFHRDLQNILWDMGVSDGYLREAEKPDFAPTYKLVREKDALSTGYGDEGKKIAAWGKCLKVDRGVCVLNKEQDFKHNPAWTDRIIVRDSQHFKITTDLYERRTFTSQMCHPKQRKQDICSDHAVITAMLSVSLRVHE